MHILMFLNILAVFYFVIFLLFFIRVICNLIFNLGWRATGLSVLNSYVLPSIKLIITYLSSTYVRVGKAKPQCLISFSTSLSRGLFSVFGRR